MIDAYVSNCQCLRKKNTSCRMDYMIAIEERIFHERPEEEYSSTGNGEAEEQENISGPTQRNSGESRARKMGFVYFIENHDKSFVKIGYSQDVLQRFSQLGVLMPRLRVIGYVPGDRAYEHKLHVKFSHLRENGEWFRFSEEVRIFIQSLTLLDAPPSPALKANRVPTGFLHFIIPEDLLKRIDDFRFKNRFTSRAAAILWLIEEALKKAK